MQLNKDKYVRKAGSDGRFIKNPIGVNTIATSSAQNDDGMFEFNLRDERYLPFEGAGVVNSVWKLELPDLEIRQFDYNSISDVLLHINYTAREDGNNSEDNVSVEDFKAAVIASLEERLPHPQDQPLTRVFSLKHDYPTEWRQFVAGEGDFEATIKKEFFPYFAQARSIIVESLKLCMWQDNAWQTVFEFDLDANHSFQDGDAFSFSFAANDIDAAIQSENDKHIVLMLSYFLQ